MEGFDMQRFKVPANSDKPVYTWEWGFRLSKEKIRNHLEEMKKRDVHAFYILPMPPTFRPDSTYSALNVPYLSEEYMQFVRYTAECAKELDMTMWLYDEPGWPSGNAGRYVAYGPPTELKLLGKRTYLLEKGEDYRPGTDVIASFYDKRIGKGFRADEDVTIEEYFWDTRRALGRADLLEPAAVERFLDCTYEAHKKVVGDFFGNVCPYMFTDEPCVLGYPWPYDFADRFIEKYGYDIRDYMPDFVGVETTEGKGKEAHIHYLELVSEIFADNYFGTIQKWCRENNIKFVGHIDRDHEIRDLKRCRYGYLLNIMRKFDVPGIDVIIQQVYPDEVPCKEGYGFFPRLASSAAAQNGTKEALTESFGVSGSGVDFDLMRYVLNYQLIRGINIFNIMALDTKENGCARPLTGKEQPLSDYYPQFHSYMARASYLATQGDSLADTALYIPVRDIFAADEYECQAAADFEAAGYALEKKGIDFDLIDDTVIRDAVREGDALKIGIATYKNIIIPADAYMPEDVKAKLEGISNTRERDLIPKSEALRTKSRVLADGKKVVLIFNESIKEVKEHVNFPQMKYLYELDLMNGEVIVRDYEDEVTFYGGELKAFLVSDEEVEARAAYAEADKVTVEGFEAAQVNTFYIDKKGTQYDAVEPNYQPMELGAWEPVYGKEFSGKVSYRTTMKVKEGEGRAYCIDLGKVDFAATIRMNGEDYGVCGMTPKQLVIPYDKMPKGEVELEVIVANTVGNFYAFGDYEKYFTAMELGPYHPRMKSHEEQEAGGGLYGPVTVSLLK